MSETDPFFSGADAGTESEGKDDSALYQDYFSQELGLDALTEANSEDEVMLRVMQELLASLYNAPMTMHSSYAARVQHDLNAK